ncbi:molybdopterin-containing oxidoreductase family protein [Arabiibacter massiliensis]|uniref:molybdopterin-containing oxidoreductase family protein n=1 Tax=Arabiibacter massiliensis TaxID=1870985 RepID=UPI0009B9DF30|nr:molybdopterin-dependent oxidoreductase [Arabiibacter massiliensis]
MRETTVSRRTFLKGSAATAALACAAGSISMGSWQAERAAAAEPANVQEAPSLCNGCSSKCGLVAKTVDGKLWTVQGNEKHPYAKGRICGRGHGLAQMAYSDERLTQPMRRKDDGSFEPIDWDTAFSEIGAKVKDIIAKSGPEALGIIQDPRPSGKQYSKRFMYALGSANVYAHSSSCNLSKESAYQLTIGASNFSTDFGNAKMVMFIGRSYGDGIRPSSVQSLADAAEHGTRIVIVDPRLNNSGIFASDWVPITPGTDIALLLGMANVLIEEDLYDHEFVENNTMGFEEFAAEVKEYTPAWAEKICDVPAERIEELARAMAKAAPAASIEASWRAVIGCSYANSFETARVITAVNALLGAWGAKGGALITSSPKAGKIEDARFADPAKPEKPRVGNKEYPLALDSAGTNLAALQAALDGSMKGLFFYNSNAAKGYAQPKKWTEALQKAELVVTIDVQMSETALQSHYVLPEVTYLERLELPEFVGGKKHFVGMRTVSIDKVHPETKTCDEIFNGLAEACGVGEYFQFTAEEWAEAQLATVGVTLDAIKKDGVVELPDPKFEYGAPKFKTASGKFEFKTDKVGEAGLNALIGYVPRKVTPKEGEFYIVGGKQGIHSHTMTQNIEALNAISREYHMERLWMAAKDAEQLGVQTGDMVEVSSSEHTGQVEVRVTQRLKPGTVFLPTHYGGDSSYQSRAYQYGIALTDFIPFDIEPGVGSMMSQEVAVTVKKVEA